MRPLAAAVLSCLLLAGCGGAGSQASVSPEQLDSAIRATQTPLVVLLWADWSRPAVEILPSAAELADEYEGAGLVFYTVSLERPPHEDAAQILASFPVTSRRFTLEEDPGATLARLGFCDVPAAMLYAPGGELLMTLDSTEEAPLTPADLADAIEALTAHP